MLWTDFHNHEILFLIHKIVIILLGGGKDHETKEQ